MLVVVFRPSSAPETVARAARALGVPPAEMAMRLLGILPRVVLVAGDDARAAAAAVALEELGFAAMACDPAAAPGDAERVVGRKVELARDRLVVWDGCGKQHVCPGRSVALVLRGVRTRTTFEEVTTSERRFAPARAVLSGGLLLTKTIRKTEVKTRDAAEPFLMIHRADGEPDLILYGRQIDYRALGPAMQPSSTANLALVEQHMRAVAPGAPFDDRAARPGFVTGLPSTGADPVDLALFLLVLAHARGCP
jgi:hypothetical protein